MEKVRYASYAEIDKDLEMLQLEREIQKQKIGLSLQKSRDLVDVPYVLSESFKSVSSSFQWNFSTIFKWIIPIVFRYYKTKKRGY